MGVEGQYIPTCFRNKLQDLIQITSPLADFKNITRGYQLIPKEIFYLSEWIIKYAKEKDGLFINGGNDENICKIKDYLDTCQEIPKNVGLFIRSL